MSRTRIVIAGIALAAGLAGCSSGSGADAEAAKAAFQAHNQAILARDFTKACSLDTPDSNQRLIAQASAAGGQVRTCEDALQKTVANSRAAAVSDGIAKTAQVSNVQVHGDTATITWTVQAQGRQVTNTTDMQRIDGQWRLVNGGGK